MSDENTLWMGDIEPWMDESTILTSFQYFNIYPISVKLIKDKNKNINKNYCFVTFKNIQDAKNALINLDGHKLPNANINFKLNKAEYQNAITKTVYVGNLNLKVGDNELLKLFSQKYKSVIHANVISEKGASKGYGFVIFKNEDDYSRCLKEMNGFNFCGNNIKVREKRKKDDENNNINNNIIGKKNKDKNKNHIQEINEEKFNNFLLNNKNNNDNIFNKVEYFRKINTKNNYNNDIRNVKSIYPQTFKLKRKINFNSPKSDSMHLENNKNTSNSNMSIHTANTQLLATIYNKINKHNKRNVKIPLVTMLKMKESKYKSLSVNKEAKRTKDDVYKSTNRKIFKNILYYKPKSFSPKSC